MTKFLVIGSNSFSGSHFVNEALKNNNKVDLWTETIFIPCFLENSKPIKKQKIKILNLNQLTLIKINYLNWVFKPEIVVNFAAQGMVVVKASSLV